MEFFFDNKNVKNIVIYIDNFYSVDELCACVLAKIYFSLKYKTSVKIVSSSFSGSEIFIVNNYEISKKDTILNFNSQKNQITVSYLNSEYKFKLTQENITMYFYNLIVKYNYLVDFEIIGFYSLLSLKCTYFNNMNQKEVEQTYLKLLKIMNSEQFYTLEYNVDQVVNSLDNYMF